MQYTGAGEIILVTTVIAATVFTSACEPGANRPVPAISVEFKKRGVIEIRNATGVDRVEVRDLKRRPLAVAYAFGRDAFELRYNWRTGATYLFIPDHGKTLRLSAPPQQPQIAFRVHAPLGQKIHEYLLGSNYIKDKKPSISLPAGPDETIDFLVEVEKISDTPLSPLRLSFYSEKPAPMGPTIETTFPEETFSLGFEFDKQIRQGRIRLGQHIPEAPLVIALTNTEIDYRVRIFLTKKDLKATDLVLNAWEMPCDVEGRFQAYRMPDQISLPNPVWNRIAALFNIQTEQVSYYEPFVYERMDFFNKRDTPLNLLLKGAVADQKTSTPNHFFTAPNSSKHGTTKQVIGYCRLEANSKKSCVLPIFVKPETPAGNYNRRIEVFAMGSDKPLRVLNTRFTVRRSHLGFSIWLVVILVASFGWLAAVAVLYRPMVSAFGVRLLTLLSLLGSLQFCFQFAGTLLSTIFYAVLGPLNCLVGGLLTEVLTYLLVTSVLYLVPRAGAMTIAGIVSYLMGGILFGSFGLTDILFTGSTIAFREVLLLLFGVTRINPSPHYRPRIAPMMLALGLADAMSTFTSLTLHSVFFRLFFADWYIGLQVVVTGFLYTAFGVYLGRSLGMSLRKVHP